MRIEIEYLMGKVYASNGEDEPEWPPHPARLFSAMVAVAKEANLGSAADEALLWFERQPPPQLRAGLAAKSKTVTCFVPPNYSKFREEYQVLPWARFLSNQERTFPAQSPSEPFVSFQWPQIQDYPPVLAEIVARIGHLGHSASLIRASVAEDLVGPTLVPDEFGTVALGVPSPGRMQELEQSYRLNQRPTPPRMQRYSTFVAPGACSTHGEMIILRQTEGLAIPIGATLMLTHAFRRVLIALAEHQGESVPEIHGHDGLPHCIYAPLPFAGWKHSDGEIKGVTVMLPHGINPVNREKIYRACAALSSFAVSGLGLLRFEGAGASELRTLQANTWKGPARTWATVTPMLLKHRPSEKFNRPLTTMIQNYCVSVGLPAPVAIKAGRYPILPGVPRAYDFCLRRKAKEPEERFAAHALLEFDRPVEGPILLGKARHFGLGLFKPLS